MTTCNLAEFSKRVYSEAGEDGILAKIFALLAIEQGFCVEFGAWDGRRLSNTRLLLENGWSGVLIEGDAEKFAALQANVSSPKVQLVHALVGTRGDQSLDAILQRCASPPLLDLLSIDIDSDDLAVWMAMRQYRARCVVIEYNITIPFDTDFVNPAGKCWGNSARTIVTFEQSRGYVLVAMTGMNLIFLDRELAQSANIAETTLSMSNAPACQRYFWAYDGTLISVGRQGAAAPELLAVPWRPQLRVAQPLPKRLRRWQLGSDTTAFEYFLAGLAVALLRPLTFVRHYLRRGKPR